MKDRKNCSSAPSPPAPTLPPPLAADRAVLRSTLREEARKAVGDTGLLDHLLKHLVRVDVCNYMSMHVPLSGSREHACLSSIGSSSAEQ